MNAAFTSSRDAHVEGPPMERLDQLIWVADIPALGSARFANREAIVFAEGGIHTSYAELERQTNAFVAALRARGLKPGERIAYLGLNNDLFFAVLFGAIRAGLVLVPLNWRRARNQEAPKMHGIYYGAMPIGESLLRDLLAMFDCKLGQYFGMTEVTGTATFLPPQQHDLARSHLLKSVGRTIAGMSLEIRHPDRRMAKTGEHGEIWIRAPTCMLGYWNLPEQTAQVLVDGWYATGDGGYLDEEGYLYLTDRIKDMIVSGGENIYPVEVQEALRQHPAVLDACVVGQRDERWGEVVVAVIELRPGASATADELQAHARTRIAGYKCPRIVRFDPLPRTASGKLQRAQLRLQLKDGKG